MEIREEIDDILRRLRYGILSAIKRTLWITIVKVSLTITWNLYNSQKLRNHWSYDIHWILDWSTTNKSISSYVFPFIFRLLTLESTGESFIILFGSRERSKFTTRSSEIRISSYLNCLARPLFLDHVTTLLIFSKYFRMNQMQNHHYLWWISKMISIQYSIWEFGYIHHHPFRDIEILRHWKFQYLKWHGFHLCVTQKFTRFK